MGYQNGDDEPDHEFLPEPGGAMFQMMGTPGTCRCRSGLVQKKGTSVDLNPALVLPHTGTRSTGTCATQNPECGGIVVGLGDLGKSNPLQEIAGVSEVLGAGIPEGIFLGDFLVMFEVAMLNLASGWISVVLFFGLVAASAVNADEPGKGAAAKTRRVIYNLDGDSCMTLKKGSKGRRRSRRRRNAGGGTDVSREPGRYDSGVH
ncbi:MAG: hypothetical protein U0903_02960 [Planctomycetales bacterium]